ncbi:hypothetical protein B0H14DRAFT_3421926 [Mycena olivaceomarginata]|nr:hypothetical protein B0H14DRAFT_3421926 [Mycena olivaceomarginata]
MYGCVEGCEGQPEKPPRSPPQPARAAGRGARHFFRGPAHLDWEKPLFGMPGDERQSSNDGLMGLDALPKPALRPPEPPPTHARDPGAQTEEETSEENRKRTEEGTDGAHEVRIGTEQEGEELADEEGDARHGVCASASLARSLQTKPPMLDHDFVDATRIPLKQKETGTSVEVIPLQPRRAPARESCWTSALQLPCTLTRAMMHRTIHTWDL